MSFFPPDKTIGALLTDLLSRQAEVAPSPSGATAVVVAEYITDDDTLSALFLCDLPLAAATAAALPMLPPDVAKDAVKDGELGDVLAENLHEVLNVAATLWNRPDQPHLRLRALNPLASAPADVQDLVGGPAERTHLAIDIKGYGGGLATLVSTVA